MCINERAGLDAISRNPADQNVRRVYTGRRPNNAAAPHAAAAAAEPHQMTSYPDRRSAPVPPLPGP